MVMISKQNNTVGTEKGIVTYTIDTLAFPCKAIACLTVINRR